MSEQDDQAVVRRGSAVADSPLVSVCLLVLADATLALRCLDSIAAAGNGTRVETVVVANGMSPEARRPLEAREDIVLVRCSTNLGFGGGSNLAARVASGAFLLFLNDDSVLADGYVARLLATAGTDPSIGAVAGMVLSAEGAVQEAGSVLWRDGWVEHIGGSGPEDEASFSFVRDVDYASANGLLVRRAAWQTVGGFDERYFPAYYEDVDLCMALREHGYRVAYDPRARLVHLESQSTGEAYRGFLLVRNRDRFADRWREELTAFPERPTVADGGAVARWSRAIHRANGGPPLLLAVAGPDVATSEQWWDEIERLAAGGWALTVLAAPDDSAEPADPAGPGRRDRLVELGVELRTGAPATAAGIFGRDWEAVLVPVDDPRPAPVLARPDGTVVPVVPVPVDRPSPGPATDAAIRAVARREPAPRHPAPAPASADPSLPTDGPEHTDLSGELAAMELAAAKADARVSHEFARWIEGELDRTRAALDKTRTALDETVEQLNQRVAYIEALPSVRLKTWVAGHAPRAARPRPDGGRP